MITFSKLFNVVQACVDKKNQINGEINSLLDVCKQAGDGSGQLKIAVYGLLNSGKSTLLNALTDHCNKEFFKTGDFRVTTRNQMYNTPDFCYIDTPGLDSDASDDQFANLSLLRSDIVLFVHNAAKELEQCEIKVLQKMKKMLGDYSAQGMIIVLSRKDSLDENSLDLVSSKITAQCKEFLNLEFTQIPVAASLYIKGCNETDPKRRNAFIKLSNLVVLKKAVLDCQRNNPAKFEQQKLIHLLEQKKKELLKVKTVNNQARTEMVKLTNRQFASLSEQINKCNDWLDSDEATKFAKKFAEVEKNKEILRQLVSKD